MSYNAQSAKLARVWSQPNTFDPGKEDLLSRRAGQQMLIEVMPPAIDVSPLEYSAYLAEVVWQVGKAEVRGLAPTVVVHGVRRPVDAAVVGHQLVLDRAEPFVRALRRVVPVDVVDASDRSRRTMSFDAVADDTAKRWNNNRSFSELRIIAPPNELTLWTTHFECRRVLAQGVSPLVEAPIYHPFHRQTVASANRAIADVELWSGLSEEDRAALRAYRDQLHDDVDLAAALDDFDAKWPGNAEFFAGRQNGDTILVAFKTQHNPDEAPPCYEARRRAEAALEVAERMGAMAKSRTGTTPTVDFLTAGAVHPGGQEYLSVASMKHLFSLIEASPPRNFRLGNCAVDLTAKSGEGEMSATAAYVKQHDEIRDLVIVGGDAYTSRTGLFAQERFGLPTKHYPADVRADLRWQNPHVEANMNALKSVYAINDQSLVPENRSRPAAGVETLQGVVNADLEAMRHSIAAGEAIVVTPETIDQVSVQSFSRLLA